MFLPGVLSGWQLGLGYGISTATIVAQIKTWLA